MQQTDQPAPKEISLTIPIIPDMEVAATNTAEAVLRFMHFDTDSIDEVKHALIEGCINAFEHSHSQDGNVYIKFVMEADALVVVIQDFGQGFEVEGVEKPVLAEKFGHSYKRGWGLTMMESLMDSVAIESGSHGTRITMTKKRTQEATRD